MEQTVLICQLWKARLKAREVAEAEMVGLLRDLRPQVLKGGPWSEKKGVFWIGIPLDNLDSAQSRLVRLGYTRVVDVPVEVSEGELPSNPKQAVQRGELIRWRKKYYKPVKIYQADNKVMFESAPDRREFKLVLSDGEIQAVKGYRGDGQALSRRGLPPHDARMLVNLVRPMETGTRSLLDPFAGVGGIVLEAVTSGMEVFSTDIDPFLMHGLAHFDARHCVANANHLPFADNSFDAIATEPPYDRTTEGVIQYFLVEMERVLKHRGRLAVYCAAWQADGLKMAGRTAGLEITLDSPVNRKGTACVVLAWVKSAGRRLRQP
jgi:SAM-dependent methyltransferase